MEGRKIVKSYHNIWRLNRTFYSFGGVDSPMPLTMNFISYFLIMIVVMHFLGGFLPGIFRYLLIPGGFAWIFDQKMIDSKNPYQFLRSIVTHYYVVLVKGHKVRRFQHYKTERPSIESKISYRVHRKP